ncbi:MAG: hypothetical protein NDI66_02085 [Pseudomonas sp.]|nr:hypothetical protein [Pseudomonas sp.]
MDGGLLVQYLLVALAVSASAGYVVRRQFPDGVRRLRVRLALPLLRARQPAWLQRIGRGIAPAPRAAQDGCGTCGGCGPSH